MARTPLARKAKEHREVHLEGLQGTLAKGRRIVANQDVLCIAAQIIRDTVREIGVE